MDENAKAYWDNQKTGEVEYRNAPETDEEAVQYISQDPAAQNIYRCYRQLGLSVSKAMINVLSLSVGQPAPFS